MAYNILFYFTDQQRWDTCGCFGQPLDITPNLDRLAQEGVKFDNAFSPQPVCGSCRTLFQTGKYPTETAYIGKWHLASDGELEQVPTIDHTVTAIPKELRGGYSGFWRAADVLEFTSHGYDDYKRTCHDGALHVPLVIAGGPIGCSHRSLKAGWAAASARRIISTRSTPPTSTAAKPPHQTCTPTTSSTT